MMRMLLLPFTFFLLFTGCVKNGDEETFEDQSTIVGKWEQTFYVEYKYYMDVTKTNMKLYYYDESKQIKYLINGDYKDKGSSVYAKDITSDTYRDFKYNMPHCNLLSFDGIKNGFTRRIE